jgi:hypothetical protein
MAQRRRPLPNRFIEYVVRPPVLLVFAILGGIYKVLFAWWLGPWIDHVGEKRLKEEIQQSVPSLFAEHGGRFVPNPQKPPKGSESVTVLAGGILFQFNRWRDELTVKAAPEAKPIELHELIALVKNSNRFRASQQYTQYFTLRQFARFLEEHFETIRLEMRDRSGPRAES